MTKRFGDRWEVVSDLREGGQAHTFLVRDSRDGSTGWVLKRLKNPKRLARFNREIAALTKLRSEHIPPIEDFSVNDETGEAFLVTRYFGPDLERIVEPALNPQAMLERFRGIVNAVYDAHSKGIVHRDIKPDNVTVDGDGRPYLVDFGICADDEDRVILTTVEAFGNRSFAAPECEAGSPDDCREPSDVYSLGKLLYWMATAGGQKRLIAREDFEPDELTIVDSHARQYISALIDRSVREDYRSRWSVTELLNGVDWALAKLAEHAAITDAGYIVTADGFGLQDTCDEGGSRSATTQPQGYRPADHEVAQSFFVNDSAALHQIDIGVKVRHGAGQGEVVLARGGFAAPSDEEADVVERWSLHLSQADDLQVVRLRPSSTSTLGPSEIYWIILKASGHGSEIAWISAPIEPTPSTTWVAERDCPNEWRADESQIGPGLSIRVVSRPLER